MMFFLASLKKIHFVFLDGFGNVPARLHDPVTAHSHNCTLFVILLLHLLGFECGFPFHLKTWKVFALGTVQD